jgi:hypothetical protein
MSLSTGNDRLGASGGTAIARPDSTGEGIDTGDGPVEGVGVQRRSLPPTPMALSIDTGDRPVGGVGVERRSLPPTLIEQE